MEHRRGHVLRAAANRTNHRSGHLKDAWSARPKHVQPGGGASDGFQPQRKPTGFEPVVFSPQAVARESVITRMVNCEAVEILSYFSDLARSAEFEVPALG